MYLDVAVGDESSVAVGEIRCGDADEKRVFAGQTRFSVSRAGISVEVEEPAMK